MMDEVFGPSTLLVAYDSKEQLMELSKRIEGQLTISLFGENSDLIENESLIAFLETKAGRILFNQFPTGVEVCPSVVHGGPYPATSDSAFDIRRYRSDFTLRPPHLLSGFS